jgi:hypothetical protein
MYSNNTSSKEVSLIILQLIAIFLCLVKKAAHDIHDKMIFTKEKLTKLKFTNSCKDV